MANTIAVFSLLFTLSTTFSLLLLLLPHCIDAQPLKVCKFDAIYQLGDSLSDTGNFIREVPTSTCARLPYGQNFLNNATGRCSNGMLMIDYFGKTLNLLSLMFICLFLFFFTSCWILLKEHRKYFVPYIYGYKGQTCRIFFFGSFLLVAVGF